MVRFWDTSAVVALLVREHHSAAVRRLLASDASMLVWSLTPVDATSALWRRRRARQLSESARKAAELGLGEVERTWAAVTELGRVQERARRLLAVHPLRAFDALQLAAALVGCDENTRLFPFVTLDRRLAACAELEGFAALPELPSVAADPG